MNIKLVLLSMAIVILLVCPQFVSGQEVAKESIYFNTGSYELTPADRARLDGIAGRIKGKEDCQVQVFGYCDFRGSSLANQNLSTARANAVRLYFKKNGIPTHDMEFIGKGELQPAEAAPYTDEMLQPYRRVDILISSKNRLDIMFPVESLTQEFIIDPDTDNILVCRQGTRLLIPAGALGQDLRAPVKIRVGEYYRISDIVAKNLITITTHDELLETRGMLYIEAVQGKDETPIRSTAGITLFIPTEKKESGKFKPFRGREVDGVIKWEAFGDRIPALYGKDLVIQTKVVLEAYISDDKNELRVREGDRIQNEPIIIKGQKPRKEINSLGIILALHNQW